MWGVFDALNCLRGDWFRYIPPQWKKQNLRPRFSSRFMRDVPFFPLENHVCACSCLLHCQYIYMYVSAYLAVVIGFVYCKHDNQNSLKYWNFPWVKTTTCNPNKWVKKLINKSHHKCNIIIIVGFHVSQTDQAGFLQKFWVLLFFKLDFYPIMSHVGLKNYFAGEIWPIMCQQTGFNTLQNLMTIKVLIWNLKKNCTKPPIAVERKLGRYLH